MRLLLAAVLLSAQSALADERFNKLDYDQDGKLSMAEAAGNADLIKGFDRNDRNRDGKLSAAEYERLLRPPPATSAGAGATSAKKPAKKKKVKD
jgi:Ca2+-binding EF-hand superfamily protein